MNSHQPEGMVEEGVGEELIINAFQENIPVPLFSFQLIDTEHQALDFGAIHSDFLTTDPSRVGGRHNVDGC